MLALLLTTGSDIKPVWLLLEAASSDGMKKKYVKTAIQFFTACPPLAQFSAFPCPKL